MQFSKIANLIDFYGKFNTILSTITDRNTQNHIFIIRKKLLKLGWEIFIDLHFEIYSDL